MFEDDESGVFLVYGDIFAFEPLPELFFVEFVHVFGGVRAEELRAFNAESDLRVFFFENVEADAVDADVVEGNAVDVAGDEVDFVFVFDERVVFKVGWDGAVLVGELPEKYFEVFAGEHGWFHTPHIVFFCRMMSAISLRMIFWSGVRCSRYSLYCLNWSSGILL